MGTLLRLILGVQLQAMTKWEKSVISHACKQIKVAISHGCQDALSETRSMSRQSATLFMTKFPDQRADFLERLPKILQEKLLDEMSENRSKRTDFVQGD